MLHCNSIFEVFFTSSLVGDASCESPEDDAHSSTWSDVACTDVQFSDTSSDVRGPQVTAGIPSTAPAASATYENYRDSKQIM